MPRDLHRFPPIVAIAAICASAGYAVGATERPRPLEGFASGGRGLLVSDSDVGRDLARRVWDERERRSFRERQEKILDDALELMAPAERRSVASPRLVEVECCRLQVLLEAIDLEDQPLEFRFHRVERQYELRETGVFVLDAPLRPPADEVATDDPHQSDQRSDNDVIELDPRHRRSPDRAPSRTLDVSASHAVRRHDPHPLEKIRPADSDSVEHLVDRPRRPEERSSPAKKVKRCAPAVATRGRESRR